MRNKLRDYKIPNSLPQIPETSHEQRARTLTTHL